MEPEEQRVYFRGRETQDDENLHTAGVKNNSKLLLMERPVSKEKKLEQLKKTKEMNKASEAVAQVRAEVDKLHERVKLLPTLFLNVGRRVKYKNCYLVADELVAS